MKRPPLLWIVLMTTLNAISGASCKHFGGNSSPMAPAAFVGTPTLEDVIYAVNANTSRVRSLQSDSASISSQGLPSLRANLAMEVPRRFRLRGSFLGPELDVGSNDEVFWMWAKSSENPGIFYARHEPSRTANARHILPVEPEWLLEAFGLVHLDPTQIYEGPFPRSDGRIEIRSRFGTSGSLTRTLAIDSTYGWIVENRIENANGQVVAATRASQYRFYEEAGVSLPHRIEFDLPPAQLSFAIDAAQYSINQLMGDPLQLWSMPQMEGYPLVNVADMAPPASSWQEGPAGAPPPQMYPNRPRTGFHPRYRGYSSMR
ncbi:MAG: hypothetical protein ACC628_04495 [Pirellulaceae bacterium]